MGTGIIDKVKLSRLLRDGKTQRHIAQVFGVTESAISKARKQLKYTVTRVASLEKAGEILEDHLDLMSQLRKVNAVINKELDRARAGIEGAAPQDKRSAQEILIKLSAEIRRQMETYLSIVEVWHDMKVMKEFQEEVLNVLDEAEPGTRARIIERLKQKRAVRGLVDFD
jgi:Trp operon repressor